MLFGLLLCLAVWDAVWLAEKQKNLKQTKGRYNEMKKILAFVLAVACTLSLAGCGGNNARPENVSDAPVEEQLPEPGGAASFNDEGSETHTSDSDHSGEKYAALWDGTVVCERMLAVGEDGTKWYTVDPDNTVGQVKIEFTGPANRNSGDEKVAYKLTDDGTVVPDNEDILPKVAPRSNSMTNHVWTMTEIYGHCLCSMYDGRFYDFDNPFWIDNETPGVNSSDPNGYWEGVEIDMSVKYCDIYVYEDGAFVWSGFMALKDARDFAQKMNQNGGSYAVLWGDGTSIGDVLDANGVGSQQFDQESFNEYFGDKFRWIISGVDVPDGDMDPSVLDALVGVLGNPYSAGGEWNMVSSEYFDASEGYPCVYAWWLGDDWGFLEVDATNQTVCVANRPVTISQLAD